MGLVGAAYTVTALLLLPVTLSGESGLILILTPTHLGVNKALQLFCPPKFSNRNAIFLNDINKYQFLLLLLYTVMQSQGSNGGTGWSSRSGRGPPPTSRRWWGWRWTWCVGWTCTSAATSSLWFGTGSAGPPSSGFTCTATTAGAARQRAAGRAGRGTTTTPPSTSWLSPSTRSGWPTRSAISQQRSPCRLLPVISYLWRPDCGCVRWLVKAHYRCEITYEDQAGRWFSDSCLAAQLTNLAVLGQPDLFSVSLSNGTELPDRATVKHLQQGQNISLR